MEGELGEEFVTATEPVAPLSFEVDEEEECGSRGSDADDGRSVALFLRRLPAIIGVRLGFALVDLFLLP